MVFAFTAKDPGSKLENAEEIAKGKDLQELPSEVVLTTADKKKLEVVLDPSGKIRETEEKKDKEGSGGDRQAGGVSHVSTLFTP